MHLKLVLNRNSGTLRGSDPQEVAAELADIFRAHGHDVDLQVLSGGEAVAAIERICEEKACDAVIAGGGDGTISAAAAAAAKSGLTLGILPLGTMNLFARSLGIPLQPAAAAEALATAEKVDVDIGEVNARFFVHHVALGLHPKMIRTRERLTYGSRLGKIWASGQALWRVIRRPPRLALQVKVDNEVLQRSTAAILVTNNPLGPWHLPYADNPRQGRFGVYITLSRRWQHLMQVAAQMGVGDTSDNPLLEQWQAKEVEIVVDSPTIQASVDGEIVSLDSPLCFKLHHHGLTVLRPRQEAGKRRFRPAPEGTLVGSGG